MLGPQRVVQHGLVVGVRPGLGAVGRQRPPAHGRLDPFGGQVGALDDAHLDPGAAAAAAVHGPGAEALQRRHRLGQVGLQHNAGLESEELGLVEQAGEGIERERQVLVLLHVEVDENGRRGVGGAEDVAQGGLGPPERVRVRPQVELRADRRHLDRDVVHVGAGHECQHVGAPTRRLGVPEHGLAQQVHVDPEPLGAQGRQVPAQRRVGGVRQQPADHGPEAAPGQRHDGAREGRGQPRPPTQEGAVGRGEEAGWPGRHHPPQLAGRHLGRFGAQHPVAEGHGEGERARIGGQAPEPGGPGPFGPGEPTGLQPTPGQVGGRVDQRVGQVIRRRMRSALCGESARSCRPPRPPLVSYPRFTCSSMFPGGRGGPRRSGASSPATVRSRGGAVFPEGWCWLRSWPTSSGGRSGREWGGELRARLLGCGGPRPQPWSGCSASPCSAEASCSASGERRSPSPTTAPPRASRHAHHKPATVDALLADAGGNAVEELGATSDLQLPAATTAPAAAPASVADQPPLAGRENFAFAPYWTLPQSPLFSLTGLSTLDYFSIGVNPNGSLDESGPGWEGFESQDLSDLITRAHAGRRAGRAHRQRLRPGLARRAHLVPHRGHHAVLRARPTPAGQVARWRQLRLRGRRQRRPVRADQSH